MAAEVIVGTPVLQFRVWQQSIAHCCIVHPPFLLKKPPKLKHARFASEMQEIKNTNKKKS